jgi:hypothetical protein
MKEKLTEEQITSAKLTIDRELQEIDRLKKMMAHSDAYLRLKENDDFKFLFEEAYFKDEAIRYTGLLAEKYYAEKGKREEITDSLQSISMLQSWFRNLETIHSLASNKIKESEENIAAHRELIAKGEYEQ